MPTWKKCPPIESAWVERIKLWAEGDKLRADGDMLFAKGDKLSAEGDKLYAEAVCAVSPKAVIDWTDGSFEIEE